MQKKHDRTKQTTQSEAGLQETANTPENNVKTDTKHTDPEENLKSKSQKHIFLEKSQENLKSKGEEHIFVEKSQILTKTPKTHVSDVARRTPKCSSTAKTHAK